MDPCVENNQFWMFYINNRGLSEISDQTKVGDGKSHRIALSTSPLRAIQGRINTL